MDPFGSRSQRRTACPRIGSAASNVEARRAIRRRLTVRSATTRRRDTLLPAPASPHGVIRCHFGPFAAHGHAGGPRSPVERHQRENPTETGARRSTRPLSAGLASDLRTAGKRLYATAARSGQAAVIR